MDLETRIAAVEKELASLKRTRLFAWSASALAVAAALFAGARPAITQEGGMTVKAPFHVVTAAGKPILTISSDADGPLVRLFGANDNPAMMLWADRNGGNLVIKNTGGQNIAEMVSRSDGAGGNLRVLDRFGNAQASMFARADGAGGNVAVYNATGKSVFSAFPRTDNRGGEIGVYDKDGKSVAAIFARSEGGGLLQIYDPGQKVIFKRPE
jgi:hypothetical protein